MVQLAGWVIIGPSLPHCIISVLLGQPLIACMALIGIHNRDKQQNHINEQHCVVEEGEGDGEGGLR